MIQAYASDTQGQRNLAALRRAGWHLLLSPARGRGPAPGFDYAMDNGAWDAHLARERGEGNGMPDLDAFDRMLLARGGGAHWVVAPDVVMGGVASLRLSVACLPRVFAHAPRALIAVQNGMDVVDVEPHLGPRVGVFVGGCSEWKEATLPNWGALCRRMGAYLHVGRVNTARRIALCVAAGANSFDGTSATRYSLTTQRLDNARRQMALFHSEAT